MILQAVLPPMQSEEFHERMRAIREMTARIWVPGDPPRRRAAAAPPAASPPPAPTTPSPIAQAYAEGAQQARRDALAAIAVCQEFGRPDLAHQVVGLSPAQAREFVIGAMWSSAFERARAAGPWQVR